jgi:aromatic-amino-acid transaminase
VRNKQVATVQTIGGSGALKVALDFLKRFFPSSCVYISDPSWENHRALAESAGFKVETYPYYDPATNGLRSAALLDFFRSLPQESIVLLHACCHNPTGVDIDSEMWKEIVDICASRRLIPLVDCAYQGFGEGLEADATAVRLLTEKGVPFLVASSFSKSFAIYRERNGALSVVTGSAQEASHAMTQLRKVVRSIYSSPPSYGAQLIAMVLNTPELRAQWEQELEAMRVRIHEMRQAFSNRLATSVKGRDFSFILKQKGMFSYSGLSEQTILALRDRFHIYALTSGRICVAAINHSNLDYICDSIATVLAEQKA